MVAKKVESSVSESVAASVVLKGEEWVAKLG
jgi:hypothetical protein